MQMVGWFITVAVQFFYNKNRNGCLVFYSTVLFFFLLSLPQNYTVEKKHAIVYENPQKILYWK
jgi:hypothetical protein